MNYSKDYDAHFNPSHIDTLTIGTINFIDDINEINIGSTFLKKGIGICKIEVYSGEGSIPHFHIFTQDNRFNSCICIYSNNYFSHGGKYTGILNSYQRYQLNDWLKDKNDIEPDRTNWQAIVSTWERANRNCKFPSNRKVSNQPDYSSMEQFKDV